MPVPLHRNRQNRGGFHIEGGAATGGMGSVYRAVDTRTGQHVAVTVLHEPAAALATERFIQEAALRADLAHPAIVGTSSTEYVRPTPRLVCRPLV